MVHSLGPYSICVGSLPNSNNSRYERSHQNFLENFLHDHGLYIFDNACWSAFDTVVATTASFPILKLVSVNVYWTCSTAANVEAVPKGIKVKHFKILEVRGLVRNLVYVLGTARLSPYLYYYYTQIFSSHCSCTRLSVIPSRTRNLVNLMRTTV